MGAKDYYGFMYNLWFVNHVPNRPYQSQVQSTFLEGGYYTVNLGGNLSLMSMNTMYYNKDAEEDWLGPAVQDQQNWIENNLKSGRNYVLLDHIYAGARFKHDTTEKPSELWYTKFNDWYFDLMDTYKSKIVIEIAGHDHFQDVRTFYRATKGAIRNLIVAPGVSPDHGQLPGFNTLKIDLDTMKAYDLVQTSADITAAYGQSQVTSVPYYQMKFTDYGFSDLTPSGIAKSVQSLQKGGFSTVKDYLSDKLGFPHADSKLFALGLDASRSFGLINAKHTEAPEFFCEALYGKEKSKEKACMKNLLMII